VFNILQSEKVKKTQIVILKQLQTFGSFYLTFFSRVCEIFTAMVLAACKWPPHICAVCLILGIYTFWMLLLSTD